MNNNKESTVIYKSYFDMMQLLLTNDSDWREAMTGLLNYGFTGEAPDSNNPLIKAVYVAALPTMKTATQRYEMAVENGKKGGRKQEIDREKVYELKEQGYTHQEIADELGCSKDGIKKIFQREGTKGTNLNDNVYVYSNVYSNSNLSSNAENADAKEERDLEERETEELRKILYEFKNRVSYNELKEKYHLKEDDANKELGDKIKNILHSREHKEAQEMAAENCYIPEHSDVSYEDIFKRKQRLAKCV